MNGRTWDEVYYGPKICSLCLNRFAMGAGRRFAEKISVDYFFVYQNDGDPPGCLSEVAMTLKTRF